jgi:hypothetical protein
VITHFKHSGMKLISNVVKQTLPNFRAEITKYNKSQIKLLEKVVLKKNKRNLAFSPLNPVRESTLPKHRTIS